MGAGLLVQGGDGVEGFQGVFGLLVGEVEVALRAVTGFRFHHAAEEGAALDNVV